MAITLAEDSTIHEANLTCAGLLGENRTKLIKLRFPQFIAPEDGDRWHQHFHCVMRQAKSKSCEVKMHRADGTLFYAKLDCLLLDENMQETIAPEIQNSSHTHELMVRIALTDISELKQVEQELSIAATVFEAQEGMLVTDANNAILKVNHAFTQITGYAAEEVIGKKPNFLSSGRHHAGFMRRCGQP